MQKVLVVDDVPDNVKLLAYDLEDAGYDVLTATDGKAALRVWRDEGPRIILTDWMMPVMDGVELCRAIRASECAGFVYIILLTAYSDKDRLLEAFDAGADDFLSKPFHQPELLARLKAGARVVELESALAHERRAIHKANAELGVLNDKLNRLATTDELTGLENRRAAMERLDAFWATATRYDQPLGCILFDIDHFKKCNDTYGHDAGDAVLRGTAATIERAARAGERPFRLGGEEFLMLCPLANADAAAKAAERMRKAVEGTRIRHKDLELSVTVSAGVAARSDATGTAEDLLKQADEALYRAKEGGRNRTCVAIHLVEEGCNA